MIVFNYIPLFGWIYAFFDYKPGIPLMQNKFIGFSNFILIFKEWSEFSKVIINTLAMNFLGILVSPLPAVFAILLTELRSKRMKKLVQTTTTLPNFISWIIVYALAFSMFSTEGLLNQLLILFGYNGQPTNLLGNRNAVWFFQTGLGIWKGLGWNAIIYIAAISGIDNGLYDAAKVDGAGRFRSIIHVTVPGLIPTYLVLLLLSIASMLSSSFEQYFVFYNSLVAEKIEVIDYYVYRIGIATADYSYATAIGISKTLISVILLFTVNFISKRLRGSSLI